MVLIHIGVEAVGVPVVLDLQEEIMVIGRLVIVQKVVLV